MSICSQIRPSAINVVRQLQQSHYEAFIVGGAVRDLLLGRTPKDFDIATSATPEQVREVFGRGRCHLIGRRFRLAQVFAGRDVVYEVSTFRRQPTAEERCSDADDDGVQIWNDNEFGTMEEDAQRRDFTVNALYLDVVGKRGIIDFNGGLQDVEQRLVRTIGPAQTRFNEDPVRMLRALKLVSLHQMRLENDVEESIGKLSGKIRMASVARLLDELLKIFQTDCSASIFSSFRHYGLLSSFWPCFSGVWDRASGRIAQSMLSARDRAFRQGDYSTSRALALATPCLAYVMDILRQYELDSFSFWDASLHKHCSDAIRSFYEGFVLPHVMTARVRDMIMMVPLLAEGRQLDFLASQAEYKYGRELLRLLVEARQWDPSLVCKLPPPEGTRREGKGRWPRRKRRRPTRKTAEKTIPSQE